jgi:hypothetical protein
MKENVAELVSGGIGGRYGPLETPKAIPNNRTARILVLGRVKDPTTGIPIRLRVETPILQNAINPN